MQRILNRKLNFWGHVMWVSLFLIAGEILVAWWLGIV